MNDRTTRRSKFNSVGIVEVHSNVSQEVIEITSDRLELILNQHVSCLEKNRVWQTPFSLLITIAIVLYTTTFEETLGIPASTWNAIFVISFILCGIWLIKCLFSFSRHLTVSDLLKNIKNQEGG